ncbi:MAG: esterase-like activity of phytase family protein [Oligoflexales bacterium]
MKRTFTFLLLTAILLPAAANAAEAKLRFIKDVNYATTTEIGGTQLGGLSGIVFDKTTNKLIAISDDRGTRGEDDAFSPRLYTFDVVLNERESTITPSGVRPLKILQERREGFDRETTFPPLFLDPEGIALGEDGSVFVSSEGLGPFMPPMVLRFSQDLVFQERLEVPNYFVPLKATFESGVQDNEAFEALALSADKQVLYTASEYPLGQDLPGSTDPKTYFSRIIAYRKTGADFKARNEYLYPLSDFKDPESDLPNGLADFLALPDGTILTLERGFSKELGNDIRLFQTSLQSATDVSGMEKISSSSHIRLAEKRLVLNLDTIVDQLDPKYRSLDNIEGIALGPKLANGNDSLILVSDNNFSENQRTLFLIFELIQD